MADSCDKKTMPETLTATEILSGKVQLDCSLPLPAVTRTLPYCTEEIVLLPLDSLPVTFQHCLVVTGGSSLKV